MKNITFINRNTIKKVVVCDEETYFMERIPARLEERNFFGKVIQKAKPFEYYTYWGSASTPEEVVEKNRKNGREIRYDKETDTFIESASVTVYYDENKTQSQYFPSYEEALSTAKQIAGSVGLSPIFPIK